MNYLEAKENTDNTINNLKNNTSKTLGNLTTNPDDLKIYLWEHMGLVDSVRRALTRYLQKRLLVRP